MICHVVFHSARKPPVIPWGDSDILDMYLIKFKSLGITKSCGFVYGSASGQVYVILFFLQLSSGHHLARAAGYLSTPTGTIESGQNVSKRYNTRQTR